MSDEEKACGEWEPAHPATRILPVYGSEILVYYTTLSPSYPKSNLPPIPFRMYTVLSDNWARVCVPQRENHDAFSWWLVADMQGEMLPELIPYLKAAVLQSNAELNSQYDICKVKQ